MHQLAKKSFSTACHAACIHHLHPLHLVPRNGLAPPPIQQKRHRRMWHHPTSHHVQVPLHCQY